MIIVLCFLGGTILGTLAGIGLAQLIICLIEGGK